MHGPPALFTPGAFPEGVFEKPIATKHQGRPRHEADAHSSDPNISVQHQPRPSLVLLDVLPCGTLRTRQESQEQSPRLRGGRGVSGPTPPRALLSMPRPD